MTNRTFPTTETEKAAHLAILFARINANAPKATITDRTPAGYGPKETR